MAAKLHELLAVETDLEGTYKDILKEGIKTFKDRQDHFKGFTRTLKWFDEGLPPAPEERKAIDTTVADKLNYMHGHIARYLDAVLQKEATNQIAAADIVVDGNVLVPKVPATALLGLERFIGNIRAVYGQIPTLPPSIEWTKAPDMGPGIYKRRHDEEQYKTEKITVPQILYEATKEHPAQLDKISKMENVGMFTKKEWCSMLTPAEKSVLLARIDKLLRAIKRARQTANRAEVIKRNIGRILFGFIHKTD